MIKHAYTATKVKNCYYLGTIANEICPTIDTPGLFIGVNCVETMTKSSPIYDLNLVLDGLVVAYSELGTD